MRLRDRLRAQYWRDWTDAILEDVYRTLWAPSHPRWKGRWQ